MIGLQRASPGRWAMPVALIFLSLAMNFALFAAVGPLQGSDTTVFRSGAAHLLEGSPLEGKEPSYVGYVALMAFSRSIGAGDPGVIAAQIAAAALATFGLYCLGREIGGAPAGIAAALLFVFNPDVARWHLYLLTDSLYMSLVAISTWLVVRASRRVAGHAIAGCAVIGSASIRPNGWLLIPLAAIYWVSASHWPSRRRWPVNVAVAIVFLAAVALLGPSRHAIERERPDLALRQGVVVWHFDGWNLLMPVEPSSPAPSLADPIAYAVKHPVATAVLAVARVGAELAHVRPFYSRAHNVLVLLLLAWVYPLALVAVVRYGRQPACGLILAVIISDLLITAMTFADWDGRFLLHTFPLIGLLAACGAARLWPPLPSAG